MFDVLSFRSWKRCISSTKKKERKNETNERMRFIILIERRPYWSAGACEAPRSITKTSWLSTSDLVWLPRDSNLEFSGSKLLSRSPQIREDVTDDRCRFDKWEALEKRRKRRRGWERRDETPWVRRSGVLRTSTMYKRIEIKSASKIF